MKFTTSLVAIAASAAVAYHGYSVQQAVNTASATAKDLSVIMIAESQKWQGEADRLNKRIDEIPQTVEEAVKAGSRQATKEAVGAPAEAAKTVAQNIEDNTRKAGRDTKAEANRFLGKINAPFRF